MSICIIGNGIIGMMTAYVLSERAPDLKIKLIGKRSRIGCASLAAAAMFNSFCEIEEGTLSNKIEHGRFLFNKKSNSLWPGLLEKIKQESKLPLQYGFGTFLIKNAATDELEDRNYDAIAKALVEFGEPHWEVQAREIKNYKPSAAKRLSKAIFIKNEGWVNPIHLINALEQILSNCTNVELVDDHCERIHAENGRVKSVKLESGVEIESQKVLLCNGAEFTNLIKRSGMESNFQRVFYGVGCTIVIGCEESATENCIRTPNRGLSCGLYSAPQTKTEVVIGASNFISPVPEYSPRLTSVYSLLKGVMEQINTDYYRSHLLRVNVGWRPTSSDTLPLIGPTSLEGLIVATGTKRDGLHCSPVIAEYLCDLVISGTSTIDMNLYSPERKLTRLYSREEAIDKYVKHTINALYQHDFNPSKNRLLEDVESHYRNEFSRLHDNVGANDWGIPVEMKDMYKYGHIS